MGDAIVIMRASVVTIFFLSFPAMAQPTSVVPDANSICSPHANICVSAPYQPAVDDFAIMAAPSSNKSADPEAMKALGVKIGFYSSDFIKEGSTAGMQKTCVGNDCIYYSKICNDRRCDYTTGKQRPRYPFYPWTFGITYTSPIALQAAEKKIFVALGAEGNRTLIPFSSLFPPPTQP